LTFTEFVTAAMYPVRFVVYLSLYFQAKELSSYNRRFAIVAMVGVGTMVTLLGFVQLIFYPALRNLYYLGWDEHLYRMFSVFLDPNFASAFFVIFLLFILDNLLRLKNLFLRLCLGGSGFLAALAVFLTYSRTGFIMLLFGLGTYLLLYVRARTALVTLGLCFVVLLLVSNTRIEGLNPLRVASTEARLQSAQHAVAIFGKFPVLGVGFNAFRYAQVKMGYRSLDTQFVNHADAGTDNSYLFVLATTGIIGFGIVMTFWIICYKKLFLQARNTIFPARGLVSGITALLVGTLFLNIMFYPMIVMWLCLEAGLIRNN
ncbi:MAG TPA: O-antigen ligase family protein, partial [Patescibacteria group bacterium]|nr:O-antigen ligase family protein [Patescibacteria group bacterium]